MDVYSKCANVFRNVAGEPWGGRNDLTAFKASNVFTAILKQGKNKGFLFFWIHLLIGAILLLVFFPSHLKVFNKPPLVQMQQGVLFVSSLKNSSPHHTHQLVLLNRWGAEIGGLGVAVEEGQVYRRNMSVLHVHFTMKLPSQKSCTSWANGLT